MTTTYTKISTDEFEDFVTAFDGERVSVPGTKEYVYDLPTDKSGLFVRLFSTLTERDNGARDSGRDAIRTLAWSRTADVPLAQATRTHRIETWRDNLTPKVEAMLARINAGEFDDATPDATLAGLVPVAEDEDAVVVEDLVDTQYGRKAVLASPFEAKDAIKSLGWDETHRAWDPDLKRWTVDASALPLVAQELAETFPLRAPAPADPEAFAVDALDVTPEVGDRVTVRYAQKNGNGEAAKSGTVESYDGDRLVFRRDDGQAMYVTDDGLFTAMSAYPYVGEPLAVEFEAVAEAVEATA